MKTNAEQYNEMTCEQRDEILEDAGVYEMRKIDTNEISEWRFEQLPAKVRKRVRQELNVRTIRA